MSFSEWSNKSSLHMNTYKTKDRAINFQRSQASAGQHTVRGKDTEVVHVDSEVDWSLYM